MPSASAYPHARLLVPTLAAAVLLTGGTVAADAAPSSALAARSSYTPGAPRSLSAMPAISSQDFVNSVGVNIHTVYTDTQYLHLDRVISSLHDLGIRHVRDGVVPVVAGQTASFQQLGAAGIKASLIVDGTTKDGRLVVDPEEITKLKDVAGDLDGLEAPNEMDCSGDPNWIQDLRTYGPQLKAALDAVPSLAKLPLLGPSFCRSENAAMFGSAAGWATNANAHDYSGGAAPELALEGRLDGIRRLQGSGMPLVMTETGYHNALNTDSDHHPVTERTAASYLLRDVLDAARMGTRRTYIYELFDEKPEPGLKDPEQHFGLVRYDGSHKPAYDALRNLMTDLGAKAPQGARPVASARRAGGVRVLGGGSLLRRLVIADPSGPGFTVAMWLATPLEDLTTHHRIPSPVVPVTLAFGSRYHADTRVPAGNNARRSLGTRDHFKVRVSGQVRLVHFTPRRSGSQARPGLQLAGPTCLAGGRYAALSHRYGASVVSSLPARGAGWTGGSPSTDATLPDRLPAGAAFTRGGVTAHLPVTQHARQWTIALWEKTATDSAPFSDFLRVSGARGALLRTYDLASDYPSHMQLSAYGAPVGNAAYGTEMWGNALPGTWHLVSLTNTGRYARLSVDGVPQGRVASSHQPLTGIDIGSLSDGFRGSLGSLAVFPHVLSARTLVKLSTIDDCR